MERTLIKPEDFAAIPQLVANGATAAELASRFGTTKNSLQVMCSRRGISLRRPSTAKAEGRFRQRLEAPLDLDSEVLEQLRLKAQTLGMKPSRLARRLIETIVRDDLFLAVLDA